MVELKIFGEQGFQGGHITLIEGGIEQNTVLGFQGLVQLSVLGDLPLKAKR
jgi:hypothetical protein